MKNQTFLKAKEIQNRIEFLKETKEHLENEGVTISCWRNGYGLNDRHWSLLNPVIIKEDIENVARDTMIIKINQEISNLHDSFKNL